MNSIEEWRYNFSENYLLQHPNKVFLGGIHLFNCGEDGLRILEAAAKISERGEGFSAIEIYEVVESNGGFVVNKGEEKDTIIRTLNYLTACRVLELI